MLAPYLVLIQLSLWNFLLSETSFLIFHSAAMKIKVAVVDDQRLFREGLISLVEEFNEFEIIIEAGNGKELISAIETLKPDIILLDLEMPEMCGVETTEYLHKNYPEIKIIILTLHDDEAFINNLLDKGAHGFMSKGFSVKTLIETMRSVMKNDFCFKASNLWGVFKSLERTKKIKPPLSNLNLSERELDVIRLISKEHSSKQIADALCISARTVDRHRENILQKLDVTSTVGIILKAMRNNLID